MNLPEAYAQATTHHQAGRLRDAEILCRQILARYPTHPDSLHLLGMIAHQSGHSEAGLDLLRRAIALNPGAIVYHGNLGAILATLGRREEEIQAYRQIIALRPDLPEGHYSLGIVLGEAERLDEAIAAYRMAVDLRPDYREAVINLADLLGRAGRHLEAADVYRQARARRPDADMDYNAGNALLSAGDLNGAIESFRQALALRPEFHQAMANLGKALFDSGRFAESLEVCRAAVALPGHVPEALLNLAAAQAVEGEYDQAIVSLERALELIPDDSMTLRSLGNMLRSAGRLDEAIATFTRALAIHPNSPELRFSRGYARLLHGDYPQGWSDYEARWDLKEIAQRPVPGVRWDGSELGGKRILLYSDQGLGDMIQLARLIPQVKARGGHVILRCQPSLRGLLANQCGIDELASMPDTLPEYDVQCAMHSLPPLLGVTVENLPGPVPYLAPDAMRAAQWRDRLAGEGRFKVGIVWAGNPNQIDDRDRSASLEAFAPLARSPGVAFYSLQKGAAAGQAPPAGMELVDWTAELNDFADTAALVAHLDLVISVDTAVAHLAGAMGKPLWVLLSFAPDWRWMLHRADSPWYPSARLFRQPVPREWAPVMQQAARELSVFALERKAPSPPPSPMPPAV